MTSIFQSYLDMRFQLLRAAGLPPMPRGLNKVSPLWSSSLRSNAVVQGVQRERADRIVWDYPNDFTSPGAASAALIQARTGGPFRVILNKNTGPNRTHIGYQIRVMAIQICLPIDTVRAWGIDREEGDRYVHVEFHVSEGRAQRHSRATLWRPLLEAALSY